MTSPQPPLKIAILMNGYDSPFKPLTIKAFQTAIAAASPPSRAPPELTFYDPIAAQTYPHPPDYDLIVLSGGTADPMGNQPWVLKMQEFLRRTVSQHPQKKICGICWGHQTICVAFGGQVGDMEKAELGITQISLTSHGKDMFPNLSSGRFKSSISDESERNSDSDSERSSFLRIHEFHRREIKVPAKGFHPLAERSQAFVNEDNTILTFQGHPEVSGEVARAMLDAVPGYMGVGEGPAKGELMGSLGGEHDGVEIWRRILGWVRE